MQRILDDLHVFVTMTEAITSDLDLDRVLQAVTDAGTRLSDADVGAFVHTADDGGRPGVRVASGSRADGLTVLPLSRLLELLSGALAGHETVRVADAREALRGIGAAEDPTGGSALRSLLGTPVVARSGEVIGALLFGHAEVGHFDQRSEDVVRLVATQAAVAVANARSYAQEQVARRAAEQAAERLGLLQAITSRLARAEDREQVLLAVTETLVGPLGAIRVGVYLREDDVYRAAGGVAPAPEGSPGLQRPQHAEFPADGHNPVAVCATERQPLVHSTLADLAERFPTVGGVVTGIEATVLLPLVVGERTLGVLALAWREPRVFDTVELDWLRSAVDQLAQALRQVELRESEARARVALRESAAYAISVSQTLQRSLLPPALPAVEALAVAVRYVPSSVEAEVGGDWYDVVPTPDGAVVLVVGDVQGHSIGAAALMGQLRVALNAYLLEGHPPQVALARVNRAMETLHTEAIATCCLVRLDPATGETSVVRAGHPLPLLWRAGDRSGSRTVAVSEVEGDGGIPLGVVSEWEWPTTELVLAAGDRLLLYTDGLVEEPGADVEDGVHGLIEAVAGTRAGRASVPAYTRQERLEDDVDAVLAAVGVRSRDDVALLACEYAGPASTYGQVGLDVVAVEQLAEARELGRRTLAEWGVPHLSDSVTLLVTEMVANALLHTDGGARLELRRHDGVVRVMVTDTVSRVPRPRPMDQGATDGRGLLVVGALALEWGVEPSGEGKTVWADLKV